jgi:predicted nucleotide-binding protein
MEKEKAKQILNSLVNRTYELQKMKRNSPSFEKWKRDARIAITNIFGPNTEHIKEFEKIRFIASGMYVLENDHQLAYIKGVVRAGAILASMVEEIDQYWSSSTPKTKEKTSISSITPDRTKVLVVHGRNTKFRDSAFSFLRSIDLQPIEWTQAIAATKKSSPNIAEILDVAFTQAQAVMVLFTGDDEARLRHQFVNNNDPDYEKELTPQSRPNVLFESGMAIGRYPERTVLVQIGECRPFSDIAGKHITHMDNTPEKRHELATKLANAGCNINISGSDWFSAGDFV